ncbi:hypothetical protein HN873_062926, partial [Arachis hypogaea]
MESLTLLLLCLSLVNNIAISNARDTIDRVQFLSDNGETIVSADETFALGFFSPGTSKNRYVGIWYNKVPKETVVWVANRNKPLTDSSGVLKVNDTGILVLLDRSNDMVVWSSNTTTTATGDPIAKLLNSGNLVVHERSKGDDDSRDFVWQSFDYPSDIILPGIKLGRNLVTGIKWSITSWSNSSDPSPGRYSLRFDIDGCPQTMMRDGSTKVFRFGSWNGVQLIGQAAVTTNSIVKYSYVFNEEEQYGMYELINSVAPHKLMLQSDGIIRRTTWSSEKSSWITIMSKRGDTCDNYATCGSYSSCNINRNPICSCLDGFVLSNKQDSSSDCVRRTSLNCRGDGNESLNSRIRKKKIIIISCVLSFGILIFIVIVIYRWTLQKNGKISDHLDEEIELPLFDMSTIISATNNFSAENILGKGGFGSVYK